MRSGSSSDRFARIVGMLIFLIGVALLVFVFDIAYRLFNTPSAQALGLKFTGDPKRDPQVAVIGTQFAWLLFRIGYLLIMSIAGSLVANKGVHFYFSALQGSPFQIHPHHAAAPTVPPPPADAVKTTSADAPQHPESKRG